MKELFDIPESLSPKLAWLRKHALRTDYDPRFDTSPLQESPETGADIYPWMCGEQAQHSDRPGFGMTEEDACIDYCRKNDITHWTLTPNPRRNADEL